MIPAELEKLVRYVKKVGQNEYSSSCPRCGGERHQDGEYPDRFRYWPKSKATGRPMGWCRRCGYIWMQGSLTPDERQQWDTVRTEIEKEHRSEIELAIEHLRNDKSWVTYHENLDGTYREYYYIRGLTDFWIDYWMLGYNPEKSVWDRKSENFYTTPALTIPIFPIGDDPISIRNRLLNPLDPNDKYRPEFKNLPTALFLADREEKPKGRVVLVEGEFKAMTTYLTIDDPEYFVVGSPGKRPTTELFSVLEDCEVIYLILDPDAFDRSAGTSAVRRMADYFKDRARIIRLPYKVDDMILSGQLNKSSLLSLIKGARRIKYD